MKIQRIRFLPLAVLSLLALGVLPAFGQAPTVAEIKQEAKVETTAEIKEEITSPVGPFIWTFILTAIIANVGVLWTGDIRSWVSARKAAKDTGGPLPQFDWAIFLGQTVLGVVSGLMTGVAGGLGGAAIAT